MMQVIRLAWVVVPIVCLVCVFADGGDGRALSWESLARVDEVSPEGPLDLVLKSVETNGERFATLTVTLHFTNLTDTPREVDTHFPGRHGSARLVVVDEDGNRLLEFATASGSGPHMPELELVPARGFLEQAVRVRADNFDRYEELVAKFAGEGKPAPKIKCAVRSRTVLNSVAEADFDIRPLDVVTESQPISLTARKFGP